MSITRKSGYLLQLTSFHMSGMTVFYDLIVDLSLPCAPGVFGAIWAAISIAMKIVSVSVAAFKLFKFSGTCLLETD